MFCFWGFCFSYWSVFAIMNRDYFNNYIIIIISSKLDLFHSWIVLFIDLILALNFFPYFCNFSFNTVLLFCHLSFQCLCCWILIFIISLAKILSCNFILFFGLYWLSLGIYLSFVWNFNSFSIAICWCSWHFFHFVVTDTGSSHTVRGSFPWYTGMPWF